MTGNVKQTFDSDLKEMLPGVQTTRRRYVLVPDFTRNGGRRSYVYGLIPDDIFKFVMN